MDNKKPTNGDTMRASAIARKLNTLMGEKKLGRKQFADAAGISEATLSKMLSGKTKPRESTLRYMEDKLGLPNMYFSTNIKNPVPDGAQCFLDEPKQIKRMVLTWKSISGEEEETEILEKPRVATWDKDFEARIPNGTLTLYPERLIWWSVEEYEE